MQGNHRGKGTRATPKQKQQFLNLVNNGMSKKRAAETLGFSPEWGYKVARGLDPDIRLKPVDTTPAPKKYSDLDGGVKDTLKDFLLFREVFFCRDKSPWAADAANRTVEYLLDKSERTYAVANTPPGIGKTTMFTHDLLLWLICGGGSEDPAFGRALRAMVGADVKKVAVHYVDRLRKTLERKRPHYDKTSQRTAELSIVDSFGRFRPKPSEDDNTLWTKEQFVVAQLEEIDLVEKEPTVQMGSRESGFLGERVDIGVWDDLVTTKNSRTIEMSESTAKWFEDEAETRVEPGGLLLLVGQRLSSIDLFRNRLDARFQNEDGMEEAIYKHIVYPLHNEGTCDVDLEGGSHRQWDGAQDGCLLDVNRMGWRDVLRVAQKPNYRTVYQQEDSNPDDVLVHPAWLEGGTDHEGYPAPGCYDYDRGFYDWPKAPDLVDYVTVDPSVTGFWCIEWWAVSLSTQHRYLIYGERRRMKSGGDKGFLDFDLKELRHVGLMEELQQKSGELGHPILVWVVEQNAAHKYLFQTNAYDSWRKKWPRVRVIPNETQRNKNDQDFGVDALLPMVYKTGFKHLPRKREDLKALNYIRAKVKELTNYPFASTDDTVMSDWFGEMNMATILKAGKQLRKYEPEPSRNRMPVYLRNKRREVPLGV